MEFFPSLKFGWMNGWLGPALLALTDGFLFAIFPKEVVARLFDRSGWPRKQVVFTVLGKLCALFCIVLLVFSPLKTRSCVFLMGLILTGAGLAGLTIALFAFRNTPADQPVTRGIYTVSRHPQIVMSSGVLLGACIAVGSWLALLLLLVARLLSHFGILAEEEVCLKQYGDAYRAYMRQVPRYFLFF
jgi:protein-S-isoprenylcysteine O-methyltransferase Ste14